MKRYTRHHGTLSSASSTAATHSSPPVGLRCEVGRVLSTVAVTELCKPAWKRAAWLYLLIWKMRLHGNEHHADYHGDHSTRTNRDHGAAYAQVREQLMTRLEIMAIYDVQGGWKCRRSTSTQSSPPYVYRAPLPCRGCTSMWGNTIR